jgi:Fic family protein
VPETELSARLGRYIIRQFQGETVRAFVPPPLPPVPPVDLARFQILLEQANQAVGRLDGLTSLLPDVSLLLYTYVRKEAVLSSQIEGTQSSLSDLLLYENNETPGAPIEDVQEVSNYVAAMNHGDPALQGTRQQQTARRVPSQSELDWRKSPRKCRLCPSAA